ncbi:MAG: hypothetical protein Q7S09_02335 [bacterium]|nr:hypothetical protein [bacterium]
MENEIFKKLEEHSEKLDRIYRSVERMRKYFLWTLIVSVVFIVLPLVGIAFVLPDYLNTMLGGGF